ncbi:hypothetical protein ACE1ET_20625, partial [Saccharicrinis sp. FJH62]|uniref:hypothetical protein n=1 Tax=Saccharicrinis sp. FJH62 TaxID=3344657 RepID=UPI0035D4AB52
MSEKRKIPDKIVIDRNDNVNQCIKIAPRDKNTYDIGFWTLCSILIFAATISFLNSSTTIYSNILIGLVLTILLLRPLILSLISLKTTTEIIISPDSLEIIKHRLLFSRRNKIPKDKISSIEFDKITVRTHSLNSYLGFKSILSSDRINYLRIWDKHGLQNNLLEYHDEIVKTWIYDYLKQKLNKTIANT